MVTSPFDVLHDIDEGTSHDGVDLRKIAAKMGSESEAERQKSLAKLAVAAPLPAGPQPAPAKPLDSLRGALTLIEHGDAPRGYMVLDALLIEWAQRDALEAVIGKSILGLDKAAFRAVLAPLGMFAPLTLSLASEHLEAVSLVLSSSAPQYPVAPGTRTRADLIANMGLTKPTRKFVNPCRPLRVAVTPHPQKEARWRQRPIRYVDVAATPGSAKPPIVLIHGHSSCAEEYDPLIAALRPLLSDVRILAPDTPGSGYSWASGHGTLSTAVYLEFIREWLREIGVTTYVPAGGSMGGNLTLQLLAATKKEEIPAGVAWSPVAWRHPSNELDWLASGALAAKSLHLFWPVYNKDKEHWYPHWTAKQNMSEIAASDAYRREVDSAGYQDAYFDLAADQCSVMHVDKAAAIRVPVRLMAGKKDNDVMGVYPSTKALVPLLVNSPVVDFFDDFTIGDHSVATEEPQLVAKKLAEWYRAHVG